MLTVCAVVRLCGLLLFVSGLMLTFANMRTAKNFPVLFNVNACCNNIYTTSDHASVTLCNAFYGGFAFYRKLHLFAYKTL